MTEPAPTLAEPLVTTATVVAATPSGLRLRSPDLGEAVARNAVPGAWDPQPGDRVVVLADGRGQRFVMGVLRALREVEPAATALEVERGEGGATRLVVRGDLELAAPTGRVRIRGAQGVEIESARDLSLRAERAVTLESHDGERARSSLRLEGDAAELRAGVLAAKAARLVTLAEEVTAIATRVDARIDEVRTRAARIETRVETLVEHAKESYREVEGLSQTRAGRLRLVAESSLTALAERAKLKARSIFAIDGESIHLG